MVGGWWLGLQDWGYGGVEDADGGDDDDVGAVGSKLHSRGVEVVVDDGGGGDGVAERDVDDGAVDGDR